MNYIIGNYVLRHSPYAYPHFPILPVGFETSSIYTVRHSITSHPLVGIISALGRTTRYSDNATNVDLQPLVTVVVPCAPGSYSAIAGRLVDSASIGAMGMVVHRRSSQVTTGDSAIL